LKLLPDLSTFAMMINLIFSILRLIRTEWNNLLIIRPVQNFNKLPYGRLIKIRHCFIRGTYLPL